MGSPSCCALKSYHCLHEGHASHGLLPADDCGRQGTKAGLFPRDSGQLRWRLRVKNNSLALLNFFRSELQYKILFTTVIFPETFLGHVAERLLHGGPRVE